MLQIDREKEVQPLRVKDIVLIGDNVLIEVLRGTEKTKGGLYIPDAARQKDRSGRVSRYWRALAVGDTCARIKPGDLVILGPKSMGCEPCIYHTTDAGEVAIFPEEAFAGVVTEAEGAN